MRFFRSASLRKRLPAAAGFFRTVAAVVFLLAAFGAQADQTNRGPVLVPIEGVRSFPEATEPLAIQHACAQDPADLQRFFRERGRKFFPSLIRRAHGYAACHIYYEPTLEGFRAARDDLPIRGLYATVHPLSFIVGRKPMGDSWDVVDAVTAHLPEAIDLTISVGGEYPEIAWRAAAERRFGASNRAVRVRASGAEVHPWSQDHFKAGHADGEMRALVPRRLFEGRSGDGETFRPLLDELRKESFQISKLSWEGGDLQFIEHPKFPGETLLAHGGSAREYWGSELAPGEYSYVLASEFGADHVLNLSSIGPHVDYLVAFLPADKIALVSQPVRNDSRLVESAVAALIDVYGDNSPARLRALAGFLATWNQDIYANSDYLQTEIDAIRRDLESAHPNVDMRVVDKLLDYADRTCPGAERACIDEEYAPAVFEADPDLLRAVADGAADLWMASRLTSRLLGLVESQLAGAPQWKDAELNRAAAELRKMGFEVIRAPYLAAPAVASEWVGIGYVNSLTSGRTLFVPSFGLRKFEDRLYRDLGRKLRNRYQIVPVDARSSLAENGGVHCVFGIVRGLPEQAPADGPGPGIGAALATFPRGR